MKQTDSSQSRVRGGSTADVGSRNVASAAKTSALAPVQDRLGNQGMQSLLGNGVSVLQGVMPATQGRATPLVTKAGALIQAKLSVGASDDPSELEADHVAHQIASGAANAAIRSGTPRIQRAVAGTSGGEARAAPTSVDQVLSSPGQPLEAGLQADMSRRFGHDFAQVQVHTGAAAARSASDINARAYTVGKHIVFGAGEFAPHAQQGRRLIAHELTHVVQSAQGMGEEIRRVPWTPTHADERTSTGADRFAAQTFELTVPALTGESGRTSIQPIDVAVFVPAGAVPGRNKVHIFFGPNLAVENGLPPSQVGFNSTMTHGLRGASDSTEWILVSVPGRWAPGARPDSTHAFNTIDTAQVQACLHAAGRASTTIDALRFSSHSRGSRGLRETLNRRLIPSPVAERVVVFDAAFSSLDRALARSGIRGSNMFALNVIDPGRLTVAGSHNLSLNAGAMRAIGYSRLIQDAMVTMPSLVIPAGVRVQLLPLPARGLVTTRRPPPSCQTTITHIAGRHASALHSYVTH